MFGFQKIASVCSFSRDVASHLKTVMYMLLEELYQLHIAVLASVVDVLCKCRCVTVCMVNFISDTLHGLMFVGNRCLAQLCVTALHAIARHAYALHSTALPYLTLSIVVSVETSLILLQTISYPAPKT